MSWETDLFALFDDLEGQAQAAFEVDRDAELADRSRAEYAGVTLASRLMASLDTRVEITVRSVGRISGELARVGQGWCLVAGNNQDWIVPLAAITLVHGASDRSVPEVAWSAVARLGLGSALRRLADAEERCVVHLVDGSSHEGQVSRVGADFVELAVATGGRLLAPYDGLVAVQSRDA